MPKLRRADPSIHQAEPSILGLSLTVWSLDAPASILSLDQALAVEAQRGFGESI